jgi:serine/threonine-protein kinase
MMMDDDITTKAREQVGRVVRDKWRLDRLLGVGGMASVYSATHRNGSRAAVKMLHRELSLNAEIKRRFLREGYVANAVTHRGAVRALDDDTSEDGAVFLVMELLEGRSLESRQESNGGSLGPEEVVFIADQLLDVLETAHSKGIVHRDIKPANVFLTPEGTVKVLDFGIARLRLESDNASMATQSGSTMGTPAFMPPEQALGKTSMIGPRSDVWAVGATLYTLLTGQLVHDGESANEQLILAATRPAPSLAANPGAIPRPLAQIIDRALAFDIEQRWPSARAMQQALRGMQGPDLGGYIHTARTLWDAETDQTTGAAEVASLASLASPTSSAASELAGQPRKPRGPLVRAVVSGLLAAALAAVFVVVRATPAAPAAPVEAPAQPSPPVPASARTTPSAASIAPATAPAASETPAAPGASAGRTAPTNTGAAPTRITNAPPKQGGKPTTKAATPNDWLDQQH